MEIPKCPKCGSDMKYVDKGKYGPFYGCTAYKSTGCDGIVNIPKSDGVRVAEQLDELNRQVKRIADHLTGGSGGEGTPF